MSRIHDALARAQQQRTEVRPSQPEAAAVSELQMPSLELHPAAETEAVDSDGWLANCTKATWTLDPAKMMFVSDHPHSSYGREQFRTLRSRLFRAGHSAPLKRILVASALPREGRSFVAANLAQALAQQHGSRVVLIDADLRSPSAHRYLGAPPAPGMSEYLRGEAGESAVVQQGNVEGLWFVPAGQAGDNPVELLGGSRMPQFLDRLSPCFDWMVVDSSPAIPVSDATLLARLCDGVVLVVAAGVTSQEMAWKTRAMFEGHTLLGVVLNRAADRFEGLALRNGAGQEQKGPPSSG